VSPDGHLIGSCSKDKHACLWDARNGSLVHRLEGHNDTVWTIVFSPDSNAVATGSCDLTVKLWDTFTGACLRTFRGHTKWINTVLVFPRPSATLLASFVSDASAHSSQTLRVRRPLLVASAGSDHIIQLWAATPESSPPGTTPGTSTAPGDTTSLTVSINEIRGSPSPRHDDGAARATPLHQLSADEMTPATRGALVHTLEGHTGDVYCLAYSSNFSLLASGGKDHVIRLWYLSPESFDKRVNEKGETLPVVSNTKTLKTSGHSATIWSVNFSPDGRRLVSGGADKTVRVWDPQASTVLFAFKGHAKIITRVEFIDGGRRVVSGGFDGSIRFWDLSKQQLHQVRAGPNATVNVLAVSPTCTQLACGGGDGKITVWDPWNGALLLTLPGHTGNITSVEFSPNGEMLVSSDADHALKMWSARNGSLTRIINTPANISIIAVSFSMDGNKIAAGTREGTIVILSVNDGALVGTFADKHEGSMNAMVYCREHTILSGGDDGRLRIWNVEKSGKKPLKVKAHDGSISFISATTDGSFAATASADKTVKIWAAGGKQWKHARTLAHSSIVRSVRFVNNRTSAITACDDGMAFLWDTEQAKIIEKISAHRAAIMSVCVSPGGSIIATGSLDGTVKLWNPPGKKTKQVLLGHTQPVSAVVISADGTVVATGSEDRTVRLWRRAHEGTSAAATAGPAPWSTKYPLRGHEAPITGMEFDERDERLLTTSLDQTTITWEVSTGRRLDANRSANASAGRSTVALSPGHDARPPMAIGPKASSEPTAIAAKGGSSSSHKRE
jgi:WD40 repeat protein